MTLDTLLGLMPLLGSTILQVAVPPIALSQTLLVVLEAIGVNCLYAVGRRKFTNIEKMRRVNAEMKAFRAELSAAQKAGDKQKLEKLKRKQQQMQKMQAEMSLDNFKPTLLFMLPLLGVYYLVSSFLKNSTLAIGPIPFQLFNYGPPIVIPFFWWYFICSFAFSGIITRLFGLTLD
jgi:uncharacterized membrane protein (DUF106 family)